MPEFLSHITTMPKNISSVAKPFAVLVVRRLLRPDFPLSYQLFKKLLATDNWRGCVLTECSVFHRHQNVLEGDSLNTSHHEIRVTVTVDFSTSVFTDHRTPAHRSGRSVRYISVLMLLYCSIGNTSFLPTFIARSVATMGFFSCSISLCSCFGIYGGSCTPPACVCNYLSANGLQIAKMFVVLHIKLSYILVVCTSYISNQSLNNQYTQHCGINHATLLRTLWTAFLEIVAISSTHHLPFLNRPYYHKVGGVLRFRIN